MDQPKQPQKKIEPNAQNSELPPEAHSSGARIEKLMTTETNEPPAKESYGEILRPSERDNIPMIDEPAEGGLDIVDGELTHRKTPENRTDV